MLICIKIVKNWGSSQLCLFGCAEDLVVPAFALREDDVHTGLCGDKAKGR